MQEAKYPTPIAEEPSLDCRNPKTKLENKRCSGLTKPDLYEVSAHLRGTRGPGF